MKFVSHVMPILSAITAVIIIAFLSYLFYLLNYPFDVVSLKQFTVPHDVYQGDPIPYTLTFDKHLNYKPSIRYYVIGDRQSPLEIITSSVNRDTKLQTVKLALVVPPDLPVSCGYRIQIDVDYQIIFGRDIPYHWTSNEFCILAPKE
jgi:hypothetical protein